MRPIAEVGSKPHLTSIATVTIVSLVAATGLSTSAFAQQGQDSHYYLTPAHGGAGTRCLSTMGSRMHGGTPHGPHNRGCHKAYGPAAAEPLYVQCQILGGKHCDKLK
jgi:hypothetical protein